MRKNIFRTLGLGWLTALLLGLGSMASAADTPVIAGQVELVEGEVKIIDGKGAERVPQVGENVFEGDTLQSGQNGELHARMLDHAFIAVRANTQLKITSYQAQGADSDSVVFSLLKGTFRSITGWVGKLNRKNYKVQTPNATLGIRGTDHEPLYVAETDEDDAEANQPGTYDKVNTGGTVIESPFGTVEVAPEQVGFAPLRAAPRLLPKVPAFYLRAKHERRIEERKDKLQRHIDERAPGRGSAPDGAKQGNKAALMKDAIESNGGNPPNINRPHRERRHRPPLPPK